MSQALKSGTRSGRSLFDTTEAATYLRQAESTLTKLRVYGGGPAFIKFGKSVRYDPDDLDEWLISRKRSSTSEVHVDFGATDLPCPNWGTDRRAEVNRREASSQ